MTKYSTFRQEVLERLKALGMTRYRLTTLLLESNVVTRSTVYEWLQGARHRGRPKPSTVSLEVLDAIRHILDEAEACRRKPTR